MSSAALCLLQAPRTAASCLQLRCVRMSTVTMHTCAAQDAITCCLVEVDASILQVAQQAQRGVVQLQLRGQGGVGNGVWGREQGRHRLECQTGCRVVAAQEVDVCLLQQELCLEGCLVLHVGGLDLLLDGLQGGVETTVAGVCAGHAHGHVRRVGCTRCTGVGGHFGKHVLGTSPRTHARTHLSRMRCALVASSAMASR